MTNEKTPLENLQNEVADYLDPWNMPAITRAALEAFLVQAFDLGVKAQRELANACPSCGAAHATEAARDNHIEAAH